MTHITTFSLREHFLLDPQIIYFNHGSFGATPRSVFESYQRWQRELELQPTAFFARRIPDLMRSSRETLAEYLGTSSQNLAYVTNATTGLNIVARSLKLGPDDEVLATDHEYGAIDRTWQFIAQKQGFKYINHPIDLPVLPANSLVDAFWQGVTPRTKVIYISHITSPTALILPVEEICRRARQQGILTVVDGAHAPGQIPLCLDELGADFYSGNLHKWLCAPKGSAFLYVRPEHHALIEPLVVSWGWQPGRDQSKPFSEIVELQGTRDVAAFLAVPDAIRFQQEHDWGWVRRHCHELAANTVQQIHALTGVPPLSPLTPQWFSQMVSATLPPGTDLPALYQRLNTEYHIEVPILEWKGFPLIRLSFQAYITESEAAQLLKALAAALN
jgi:isopenicillin-N epimerase